MNRNNSSIRKTIRNMKKTKKKQVLNMNGRLNIVKLVCLGLVFVVIFNMGNLSIAQHDKYIDISQKNQLDRTTIPANRGAIYDCNMEILAQSATVWTVIASPMDFSPVEKKPLVAEELAKILDMDSQEVLDKLNKKNRHEKIKIKVEKPVVDEIRAFLIENKISGITFAEDTKRYYPNNNSAAQLIGFTGNENQGQYGVELSYNSYLSGTPGYTVSAKNGLGGNLPTSYENKVDPINGNSLVLTLDETVQHFLDKVLKETDVSHKPKQGAAGIVMKVKTGEILAMSTMNDFDLNAPREISNPDVKKALDEIKKEEERRLAGTASDNSEALSSATNLDSSSSSTVDGEDSAEPVMTYNEALLQAQQKQWDNKAISYAYQPGSVFKPVTASAALEEKTANLKETHYCPGYIKVADRIMKCHVTSGHGVVDFRAAMVGSCNPAFVEIGQKLGADNFFKYLKGFGLTEKTGIDLPGEGESMYYTADKLGIVELASSSFGQSTAATPIQMLTAICAIANDGYLMTPYVVKDILDENGNIVESRQPVTKRQVISKETSDTMKSIMESVVSARGGSNAYIKGYQIGGKSGTSQKQGPGDDKDAKISSYAAFAPADDPEVAVIIMVDEPTSGQIYGSVVAGPAVSSVMADILPYLGYEPKYTEEELEKLDSVVPYVVDQDILFAKGALNAVGLKARIIGDGKNVVKQVPNVGGNIATGGTVILYTESVKETMGVVPNVVGMTPFEANRVLTNAGFTVCVSGGAASNVQAKVQTQSMEGGIKLGIGNIITITIVKQDTD